MQIPRSIIIFSVVTVAQGEGVVEPDAVANNFSPEAVAFLAVGRAVAHQISISNSAPYFSSPQVDNTGNGYPKG